jgi:hypothetical protein
VTVRLNETAIANDDAKKEVAGAQSTPLLGESENAFEFSRPFDRLHK